MTWSLHIARFDRFVAYVAGAAIASAAPDYARLCFTPALI
jgi:hypothetical protein